MKEVFYEVIKEACNGDVIIDNEPWPCGFNTRIIRDGNEINYYNDTNKSMLFIKNEESFFELLEEYVDLELQADRRYYKIYDDVLRNKMKAIITYLFVNATTEEFLNPEDLIRRKIAFLNDDTFNYLDDSKDVLMDDFMFNSNVRLQRVVHGLVMETPYKMSVSLVNGSSSEESECPLADITYGICEESGEKVCYVYSIMKPKEKKNISDVTHSFVLALTTFISMLQKEGISKIRAVPYLPVRYLGREVSAYRIEDEKRKKELLERNDMIQSNATEKFIRVFRRVAYHMGDAMELVGLPYENDEYLTYRVYEKREALNNEILEKVSNGVFDLEREKRL